VCLYERESERESVCACVCVRVMWVFVSLEGCAIDDVQWHQCAVGIYIYSCSVYKEVAMRYILSQECALMMCSGASTVCVFVREKETEKARESE